MSEQQNLETVREVYAAFGRGDVAFIVAKLTDDIRWVSHFDSAVPSSFTILRWRPPSSELVGLPTVGQTGSTD
jgi:hypothetical protein